MKTDEITAKAEREFDETFKGVVKVSDRDYKIFKLFFSLQCASYYQMGKIDALIEKK
jgi:hypothetical protein